MDPTAADRRPGALVLDDDPLTRMYAADILDEAGFRTFQGRNADEAISILEIHHAAIRLLFTDVQMPGSIDGFALARTVGERWPHISVLVASGARSPAVQDLPLSARFVSKPFSAQVIEEYLERIFPD